jgi:hypothetical protein
VAKSFNLPRTWRQRWRLKIRDKERVEPPHVSLIRGTECWRLCLRTGRFLDRKPDPRQVPKRLLEHIERRREEFIRAWDELYPHNPVESKSEDEDIERERERKG